MAHQDSSVEVELICFGKYLAGRPNLLARVAVVFGTAQKMLRAGTSPPHLQEIGLYKIPGLQLQNVLLDWTYQIPLQETGLGTMLSL